MYLYTHTYVCVCVYVYVYTYLYKHARIYILTFICTYVCPCIWKNIFVFVESWSSVHIQMQILTLWSTFHICISSFLSSFASWCISLLISTFSFSAASPMKWRWKIMLTQFHDVTYHKSAIFWSWEHHWAERMEIFQ